MTGPPFVASMPSVVLFKRVNPEDHSGSKCVMKKLQIRNCAEGQGQIAFCIVNIVV
jgi:hypothetical protein